MQRAKTTTRPDGLPKRPAPCRRGQICTGGPRLRQALAAYPAVTGRPNKLKRASYHSAAVTLHCLEPQPKPRPPNCFRCPILALRREPSVTAHITMALPKNAHVSRHPCLAAKLSQLRSASTSSKDVQALVHDISLMVGYEALAAGLDLKESGTVRRLLKY